jgi:hypothetical protein
MPEPLVGSIVDEVLPAFPGPRRLAAEAGPSHGRCTGPLRPLPQGEPASILLAFRTGEPALLDMERALPPDHNHRP